MSLCYSLGMERKLFKLFKRQYTTLDQEIIGGVICSTKDYFWEAGKLIDIIGKEKREFVQGIIDEVTNS